jgi:ABC-type microcin C transport system permease subunit YejB
MIMEPVLGWVSEKLGTLARYGQRPATLWDIRLSVIASQLGLMALAALILWAVL